jgi:hypothetical protein
VYWVFQAAAARQYGQDVEPLTEVDRSFIPLSMESSRPLCGGGPDGGDIVWHLPQYHCWY